MSKIEIQLPAMLLMGNYKNHFDTYFEAVYEVFKNDFVNSQPTFRGRKLGLKKHPLVFGKEATFYHLTHSGEDEQNRLPEIPRMERIPYPRPIIDNSDYSCLRVWANKRGYERRILLYHELENYLVVLADRGHYILPWTAYLVDHPKRKEKILNEYTMFLKSGGTL